MEFTIKDFKGVIPALLTVFDAEENIDETGMRQLVSHLIDQGVDGLYIAGSTGEGFTMTNEERKHVVEIIMDETAGRVPVVVHVGAIGTKITIELAEHAKACGAVGISSVPPFYYHFTEDQIVSYYQDIEEAVDLPMIVYNVPLAGLLGMNVIRRLASLKGVAGIKYTAATQFEITEIKKEMGEDFLVYSGADEMALNGLLSGADGIIGSFYNIIPEVFMAIFQAKEDNNMELATQLQSTALDIIMIALSYPSFYAVMKTILRWKGVQAGYCRRPFQNLSPEQEIELLCRYKALKVERHIKDVDFLNCI